MSTSWHKNAVALTGTIGSGKSTVAGLLRELGAFTASADDFARQAVAPGAAGLKQVVQHFGPDILLPDGSLDRKKLGLLVFSQPEERKRLEEITHPYIRTLAKDAFELAAQQKYPLLVYECPLLFETGLDKFGFSKILLVTAPSEICIQRIIERDKLSPEEARKRIEAQYPVEEKRRKSDIIIENSATKPVLQKLVEKLFSELTKGNS